MSVWKSNGVWTFKVTITDAFGNKKQVRKQSKEWNRKDALEAERTLLFENQNDSSMPFDKLATEYFKWVSEHIKRSSLRTMTSEYRNMIQPYFGKIAIDQINNKMIISWQSALLKRDIKDRYLSVSQALFKEVLEYAVMVRYLGSNPFTIPYAHIKTYHAKTKTKDTVLTVEQFNRLLSHVDNRTDEAIYIVLFWAGLRIGEALALQLKDYDSKTGKLTVDKTYSLTGQEVTSPKTMNSYRSITLNKTVRATLDDLIGSYTTYGNYSPERLLFGYDKHINYTSFSYRHRQYIKKAKLPSFTIHSLRHSCVSVLISMDANPVFIAKRMGHSVEMVLKTYSHLFPDDDSKMAEMQDSVIFSQNLGRS